MKVTAWGVMNWAGRTMSPSFSPVLIVGEDDHASVAGLVEDLVDGEKMASSARVWGVV
ncbi:MAG: hypothetical protein R3B67_10055 [Phycisphaerales bacterium]